MDLQATLEKLGFSFIPKVIQGRASELDIFPDYLAMAVQFAALAAISYFIGGYVPVLVGACILATGHGLWCFLEQKNK